MRINLMWEAGRQVVEIDGRKIEGVTGVSVDSELNSIPEVTLAFDPASVLVAVDGQVDLDQTTAELLCSLGWRDPDPGKLRQQRLNPVNAAELTLPQAIQYGRHGDHVFDNRRSNPSVAAARDAFGRANDDEDTPADCDAMSRWAAVRGAEEVAQYNRAHVYARDVQSGAGNAVVDPVAHNIVNQLFDLLTEEISRRADEPLQKYLLVDARQASNDRADEFVTKLLAAVRHEHGERIAREFEAMKSDRQPIRGVVASEWDQMCDDFARHARDLSPGST